ncbi:hypothetical protein PSP6_800001 [Paraburkholderia tropica]|nr:hypothetical protein PSP6_800001 [Paraburkholderia tropica]
MYRLIAYRGFESPSLRQEEFQALDFKGFFLFYSLVPIHQPIQLSRADSNFCAHEVGYNGREQAWETDVTDDALATRTDLSLAASGMNSVLRRTKWQLATSQIIVSIAVLIALKFIN